jgi:hypothetical protein
VSITCSPTSVVAGRVYPCKVKVEVRESIRLVGSVAVAASSNLPNVVLDPAGADVATPDPDEDGVGVGSTEIGIKATNDIPMAGTVTVTVTATWTKSGQPCSKTASATVSVETVAADTTGPTDRTLSKNSKTTVELEHRGLGCPTCTTINVSATEDPEEPCVVVHPTTAPVTVLNTSSGQTKFEIECRDGDRSAQTNVRFKTIPEQNMPGMESNRYDHTIFVRCTAEPLSEASSVAPDDDGDDVVYLYVDRQWDVERGLVRLVADFTGADLSALVAAREALAVVLGSPEEPGSVVLSLPAQRLAAAQRSAVLAAADVAPFVDRDGFAAFFVSIAASGAVLFRTDYPLLPPDLDMGPFPGSGLSHGAFIGPPCAGAWIDSSVPGTTVLHAAGADIWRDGDQFLFAYSRVAGDFSARVTITGRAFVPGSRWGKHGIMARQDLSPRSRYTLLNDNGANL